MEELISLKNINAKVEAKDWKEAITKAGELLAKSEDISEEYIKNMIDSVIEYGPYIVLSKGFALAHAAPSEAVKRSAISLINLKKPINFGSNNDPVSVVMCLACVDRKAHLDSLQKLSLIIMKENMIDILSKCESDIELYETINDIRKEAK